MSFWEIQARFDWDVYHDKERIKVYVEKEKISEKLYQDITGEPYII